MELLDLPRELFQHIIHILVEDVGPAQAFDVSFTCKTFSTDILENIFKFQPLVNLFCTRDPRATRLFQAHGTDMIIMRRPKATDRLNMVAEAILNKLFEIRSPVDEPLRQTYLRNIFEAMTVMEEIGPIVAILTGELSCEAMSAAYLNTLLPAAAAAIGDLKTFIRILRDESSILQSRHDFGCPVLPSAFNAAAANGSVEVVKWILAFIRASTAGLLEYLCPSNGENSHISGFQRKLTFKTFLRKAYAISTLKRHHKVSGMIGAQLAEINWTERYNYMAEAVWGCITNGDLDTLQKFFDCRKSLFPKVSSSLEAENGLPITLDELTTMFEDGDEHTWERILQTGLMHPSRLGVHIPLDLAIQVNRYDLVKLLLKEGADINARGEKGQCVLQSALEDDNVVAVQFLIENGADIASVDLPECGADMCTSCRLGNVARAALHALPPGTFMDRNAWRALWNTMKDGELLKSTWDRYEEVRDAES